VRTSAGKRLGQHSPPLVGGRAGRAPRGPRASGAVLDRLILDTTILIAAERGDAALEEHIGDDDVTIAAITAAEVLVGELLATGGKRRDNRRAFVGNLLATVPVEPYDLEVARTHAQLLMHIRKTGTARGAHDLIAATACAHKRTVVTADLAGFAGLPDVALRHATTRT